MVKVKFDFVNGENRTEFTLYFHSVEVALWQSAVMLSVPCENVAYTVYDEKGEWVTGCTKK